MKIFRIALQNVTRFLFILLTLTLSVTFIQCGRDIGPNEEANNKLAGHWNVVSFRIDGLEQLQFTVTSFEMEYIKESEASGVTEWTLVNVLGATTTVEGDYTVLDGGMRIEIDGDGLNLELSDTSLSMDGNIGGQLWEMDAEKE